MTSDKVSCLYKSTHSQARNRSEYNLLALLTDQLDHFWAKYRAVPRRAAVESEWDLDLHQMDAMLEEV